MSERAIDTFMSDSEKNRNDLRGPDIYIRTAPMEGLRYRMRTPAICKDHTGELIGGVRSGVDVTNEQNAQERAVTASLRRAAL